MIPAGINSGTDLDYGSYLPLDPWRLLLGQCNVHYLPFHDVESGHR